MSGDTKISIQDYNKNGVVDLKYEIIEEDGVERNYTSPVRVGINTMSRWNLTENHPEIYSGKVLENPHMAAREKPQKFWITAENLIAFLTECMGYAAPKGFTDVKSWKKDASQLYEEARKDIHYPDFVANNDIMNWYKFNRTYTENITRYYGKGISFCYNNDITNRASVLAQPTDATCMISYMYDSDPKEVLEVLQSLIEDKVIEPAETIFFCSFANFQVNNSKFNQTPLGYLDAPTVDVQVDENPFRLVSAVVKKFIILHTGGDKDIYSRKWCCYELSRAAQALCTIPSKRSVYMVGSATYFRKVMDAKLALEFFFDKYPSKRTEYNGVYFTNEPNESWEEFCREADDNTRKALMVLKPADTEDSECQDNSVDQTTLNMLNAGIEEVALQTLPVYKEGYKKVNKVINRMRSTVQSVPGGKTIVKQGDGVVNKVLGWQGYAPITEDLKGFKATNYVINQIRYKYQQTMVRLNKPGVVCVELVTTIKQSNMKNVFIERMWAGDMDIPVADMDEAVAGVDEAVAGVDGAVAGVDGAVAGVGGAGAGVGGAAIQSIDFNLSGGSNNTMQVSSSMVSNEEVVAAINGVRVATDELRNAVSILSRTVTVTPLFRTISDRRGLGNSGRGVEDEDEDRVHYYC